MPIELVPARSEVPQTLGLAAVAVLSLGLIEVLAGAPPSTGLALVAAPAVAGVHVALLTLPGLWVAQSRFGLAATPAATGRALAEGLAAGTALLLATLPLVLFFGASLGTARTALWLSGAAGTLALVAGLARIGRTLTLAEAAQRKAIAVYGTWALLAGAVGLASASDAIRTLGGGF